MINYNKIDDIIEELEDCVKDMGRLSDTQLDIMKIKDSFSDIIQKVEEARESIKDYTRLIEDIDNNYVSIVNNIEKVLQDYAKVHSSFELVDIELKRISALVNKTKEDIINEVKDTVLKGKKQQEQVIDKIDESSSQVVEHISNQSEQINIAQKQAKTNSKLTITSIVISAVALIIGIINIFV